MHLAMEDNALYPRLLAHKDESVMSTAMRFIDEIGGIKDLFSKYTKRWPSTASTQNRPTEFIKETEEIFSTLSKRIEMEDNELFPLLENLG